MNITWTPLCLPAGLQSALSTVTNPATNQPMQLDIIGFDACLMSMWEIGSVLSPYAKHLMGSELLEPGTGWDYSSLFYMIKGWAWSGGSASPRPINGVTGYTAKDLAEIIIGGYMVSPDADCLYELTLHCAAHTWRHTTTHGTPHCRVPTHCRTARYGHMHTTSCSTHCLPSHYAGHSCTKACMFPRQNTDIQPSLTT
jgi:hypothetical protein